MYVRVRVRVWVWVRVRVRFAFLYCLCRVSGIKHVIVVGESCSTGYCCRSHEEGDEIRIVMQQGLWLCNPLDIVVVATKSGPELEWGGGVSLPGTSDRSEELELAHCVASASANRVCAGRYNSLCS